MQIELKKGNMPTKEEILDMAKGQSKVIIRGEEPLNRTDIIKILKGISCEELVLETDGQELKAMAADLKNAGVTGVIVVVNTFNHTRYNQSNTGKHLDPVIEGINEAVAQNLKIRLHVALKKGFNDDEVLDFLQLTFLQDYEIIFLNTMNYDEIKEKMPALMPALGGDENIEMFRYPVGKGKLGFLKN
ncbi:MAG: radical SAM protein [Anaerovoracaceae bacterium]